MALSVKQRETGRCGLFPFLLRIAVGAAARIIYKAGFFTGPQWFARRVYYALYFLFFLFSRFLQLYAQFQRYLRCIWLWRMGIWLFQPKRRSRMCLWLYRLWKSRFCRKFHPILQRVLKLKRKASGSDNHGHNIQLWHYASFAASPTWSWTFSTRNLPSDQRGQISRGFPFHGWTTSGWCSASELILVSLQSSEIW